MLQLHCIAWMGNIDSDRKWAEQRGQVLPSERIGSDSTRDVHIGIEGAQAHSLERNIVTLPTFL